MQPTILGRIADQAKIVKSLRNVTGEERRRLIDLMAEARRRGETCELIGRVAGLTRQQVSKLTSGRRR